MTTVLTIIHILAVVFLILAVLIQQGKGSDVTASLGGGGGSGSILGSGGGNFFTKFTAVCAVIFMTTSITLTVLNSRKDESVFENVDVSKLPVDAKKEDAPAKTQDATKKEDKK